MKAYAFRRGGSSFVSSLDDLPAKLGARTNRARSLHQSVLLEMLELAKRAGDVVRNKPLDCVADSGAGPTCGPCGPRYLAFTVLSEYTHSSL
jgi:hypothetical protein